MQLKATDAIHATNKQTKATAQRISSHLVFEPCNFYFFIHMLPSQFCLYIFCHSHFLLHSFPFMFCLSATIYFPPNSQSVSTWPKWQFLPWLIYCTEEHVMHIEYISKTWVLDRTATGIKIKYLFQYAQPGHFAENVIVTSRVTKRLDPCNNDFPSKSCPRCEVQLWPVLTVFVVLSVWQGELMGVEAVNTRDGEDNLERIFDINVILYTSNAQKIVFFMQF